MCEVYSIIVTCINEEVIRPQFASIQSCLVLSSSATGVAGVAGAALEATAGLVPIEIGQGLSVHDSV